MVAGGPERTKRKQMSPKPLQTHYELLHPTHRGTVDEQYKDRESHKQRMLAGVLLWARILELTVQFATATQIYDKNQSRGI